MLAWVTATPLGRPVDPEISVQFQPAEDPEPNDTPEAVKPEPVALCAPLPLIRTKSAPEGVTASQILGYRTILNEEKLGCDIVCAVIEVKITPERENNFNRLANRTERRHHDHAARNGDRS